MKNVRIKETDNESIARVVSEVNDFKAFNMQENSIDALLEKEKAAKFNAEVEKANEQFEAKGKDFEESKEKIDYDITKAEIKPMFSRVLLQPFKVNPFQKMEVKNGIIVDAGGYSPRTDFNPVTGKYEEMPEFMSTGCVIETGPDVKYLKEGDCVFYRRDTAVPVPFFKGGFVSLDEKQIVAVVNEGLQERFNKIKNDGRE